jgi:hypothetical protein
MNEQITDAMFVSGSHRCGISGFREFGGGKVMLWSRLEAWNGSPSDPVGIARTPFRAVIPIPIDQRQALGSPDLTAGMIRFRPPGPVRPQARKVTPRDHGRPAK